MQAYLTLVVATLVCCACNRDGAQRRSSHVGIVTELADVKALHAPPAVIVRVIRSEASGGFRGCHAGAACLVFLPFLLWEELFAESAYEVDVTVGGEPTFTANYDSDAQLISARAWQSGGYRQIEAFHLPVLGRSLTIERARVQADGVSQPTSVLAQVDLLSEYRTALLHANAQAKSALLHEAWLKLPGEADEFVAQQLSAATDESRALLVTSACHSGVPEPRIAPLLASALAQGGAKTRAQVDSCGAFTP